MVLFAAVQVREADWLQSLGALVMVVEQTYHIVVVAVDVDVDVNVDVDIVSDGAIRRQQTAKPFQKLAHERSKQKACLHHGSLQHQCARCV